MSRIPQLAGQVRIASAMRCVMPPTTEPATPTRIIDFPASAAPQYITDLHDAVAHNPGTIDSAKVPSPSSLGHAIDDAVIYLGESATAKDAKRVAEQIVGTCRANRCWPPLRVWSL